MVIPSSLIPIRHGDRIKTDHRDARKLADLLRAGLLAEVRPLTEDEEAVRDLCRSRDAARLGSSETSLMKVFAATRQAED